MPEKILKDTPDFKLEPLQPFPESVEIPVLDEKIVEEPEKEEKIETPEENIKYERERKNILKEPSPELNIKLGKGKKLKEPEEPDINLRYKQGELPVEPPEEIKLKPWQKENDNDQSEKEPEYQLQLPNKKAKSDDENLDTKDLKQDEKPKIKKKVKKIVKKPSEADLELERLLNLEVEKTELEKYEQIEIEIPKKTKIEEKVVPIEPTKLSEFQSVETPTEVLDTPILEKSFEPIQEVKESPKIPNKQLEPEKPVELEPKPQKSFKKPPAPKTKKLLEEKPAEESLDDLLAKKLKRRELKKESMEMIKQEPQFAKLTEAQLAYEAELENIRRRLSKVSSAGDSAGESDASEASKPEKRKIRKVKKTSSADLDAETQRLLDLELERADLEQYEKIDVELSKREKEETVQFTAPYKRAEKLEQDEPDQNINLKFIKKDRSETPEADDFTLKRPKQFDVPDEENATITLKKVPMPEKEPEIQENVTFGFKKKPIEPVIEDVEVVETIKRKKKPKKTEEVETAEISFKKPSQVKISSEEAEATFVKTLEMPEDIAIVEEPEQLPEEFVFRRKSKPKVLQFEEHEDEFTLKKLKKPRKPSLPEHTEPENVTFRPKRTTHMEEVEQEFKIQLDSYQEEEISMSGKVKLKKPKPVYSEDADEHHIRIIQEVDDDGPIIEEIIDDDSEPEDTMYDVDEPDEFSDKESAPEMPDNVILPLRRRRERRQYKIQDYEEESVSMGLPRRLRKKISSYDEDSLQLKLKKKSHKKKYIEEENSLSITRELKDEDLMVSICSVVSDHDDTLNLVEGEKVYVVERYNADWWFVRKQLTNEKGWTESHNLMDTVSYTHYVQKKLNERIDKLPVFEKPASGEKSSAPKFIEKLQPHHTAEGYTIQLECKVDGLPRPQITWFRQTQIILPSPDFQMYYDDDNVACLIIREVFAEDAGTFTCVAKNAAGFASNSTELTVETYHESELNSRRSQSRESSLADILEGIPPIFSKKPKVKCVDEGTNVILDCRLVAVPEPKITWLFNGKELSSSENVKIVTKSDNNMYCTVLQILNVQKRQEGTYEIVAKNKSGESILPIKLKIKTGEQEKPEILEPLRNTMIKEGETITLSTQVTGEPIPKVQWFKDGNELIENVKQEKDVHSLTIVKVTDSDNGEYTLKATNTAGTAFSGCSLTVESIGAKFESPIFLTRFEEVLVKQKEDIILKARVYGTPTPDISWLRNNKPLSSNERIHSEFDGENITLTIKCADSETDSGDYKCIASNIVGKASHGAKVTVDVDKVAFTKQLHKTYNVEENKMTTLECETSHSVPTKWFQNKKELSGMDHRLIVHEGRIHKLIIRTASFGDAGDYTCEVKDQSTSTNLKVIEAKPEFIRKLEDLERNEQETIVLEVEISSETAIVSWYKDGEEIKPKTGKTETVKNVKVHQLIVYDASVYDEGEYICVLADQECSGDVTVIELPPRILYELENITIAQGEKASFEVELTKGDALVKWFKNSEEIQFSDHVQLRIDGKKQKLKIYDAVIEDSGEYSCIVADQVSSATLTVERPLVEFIKKLPDITLGTRENDVIFSVKLSHSDVPVEWFQNNVLITNSEKFLIIDEGFEKKLILKNAHEEDANQYSCVASNVKSSTKLKVEVIKSAPTIHMDNLDKTYKVRQEEDVTFVVKFNAYPLPDFEWSCNGKALQKTKRFEPKITDQSASLTIKRCIEDDAGDYSLKLINSIGEAETSLKLIFMNVPSRPGSPAPVEITDDTITLFWKAPEDNGNSEITEYVLEYKILKEKSWQKVMKIKEATHTLTGLVKNTEMAFRVTAINEIGASVTSAESQVVITKPLKLEKPSFTEELKDITIGLNKPIVLSCVVSGMPIPEITWYKNNQAFASKFLSYENRYAKFMIESTTEQSAGDYTCKAINEAGECVTNCKLTVEEKPMINVDEKFITQNLRVSSQYEVVADFTGFPAPKISWFKDNMKVESNDNYTVETSDYQSRFIIKTIERHHSGKISVKAKNTAGSACVELTLNVIDKPSKPEGPLLLREISEEAVILEWKPPGDDGGLDIQNYSIEKMEPNQKAWIKIADVDKNISSYCIQNLAENSQYLFRVIAKNPMGSSEPLESEAVTVKRVCEPPSPPRGPIEISGMTETTFTLSWKPSEKDGGSRILEYAVEMRETNKKVWKTLCITTSDQTSAFVQKLVKDQGYHFRISARNKIGTSDPLMTDDKIIAGRQISELTIIFNWLSLMSIFIFTEKVTSDFLYMYTSMLSMFQC